MHSTRSGSGGIDTISPRWEGCRETGKPGMQKYLTEAN
jgi:hypothetical protein